MKHFGRFGAAAVSTVVLLFVIVRCAHAYVDPGTASFLIQVLVGTALGCALLVKIFWQQVKAFAGRSLGHKSGAE